VQPASREVACSFRGSVRRVAPCWLGALPPPSWTAARYSSSHFLPALAFRETLSWSLAPLQSSIVSLPPALDLRSSSAMSGRAAFSCTGSASLELLLLEHNNSECPVSPDAAREQPRGGWGSPLPHRCRPQGWFPLDGSRCAMVCSDPVKGPPWSRSASELRGLLPCRSRPWSRPSEPSPLEEPYPLSWTSCFLAGSRSTAACAVEVSPSRGFHRRVDPLPRLASWARRTHGP